MKRCSMMFSITGIRVKIQAGSHWPWRSPSEQAAHATKMKPKNHSRRSRQKTARPADHHGEEAPADVGGGGERCTFVPAERE